MSSPSADVSEVCILLQVSSGNTVLVDLALNPSGVMCAGKYVMSVSQGHVLGIAASASSSSKSSGVPIAAVAAAAGGGIVLIVVGVLVADESAK